MAGNMKIALFFFSGTGNTRWVAEILNKHLSQNTTVDLFDLEKEFEFDHHDYDKFIVAHPVYGAHVPRFVIERVDELIPGNKKLTVIATFGYVNALGYFAEKKMLGRDIDAYFNVKMFNNISTPRLKTSIKAPDKRLGKKAGIEAKIKNMSDLIMHGKKRIQGIGPQLIVGIKLRKTFQPGLQAHYQTLGVDLDCCTHCGRCVRECPTHSIFEENGKYRFEATCTACMRCYNFCPVNAITINGKFADPDQYTRYTGPWE